jgi:hypothetical protein
MKTTIALALLAIQLPTFALQINITYDTNGQVGSVPPLDADGSRLLALTQAAADYWEDIIEDAHTLNVIVRYDNSVTNLSPGTIGLWNSGVEAGGRWISGVISIRGTTPWYYDASPTDHSEYDMTQVLYRNASANNATNFVGTVPGVLEISYTGTAKLGSPAVIANNTDLYSVLLHELGHGLGLSVQLSTCAAEVADGDYDVSTSLVNGNVMSIVAAVATGAHTTCAQCLMNANIPTGLRRLPCAADVLALSTAPSPGWSNLDIPRREFLPGGTTDWNTAANWVGGKVPGTTDDASCRYSIDVPGDILLGLSGTGFCQDLYLSGSTSVRTFAHKLDVTRNVLIEYDGNLPIPEIFVENGGELEAVDVTVNGGDLDLSGGLVDLSDDLILSEDTLGRQGNVSGYGTVDVAGTLVNNGRITATDGGTLTFISANTSPWDLDGGSGNGEVLATTGNLDFSTGAVADAFDGLMQVNAPYSAHFGETWSLGAGGVINLVGGSPQQAVLSGAAIQASDGALNVAFRARINAPITFGASVETLVFPNSSLVLSSNATFNGGAYLVGTNSAITFSGSGSISGGTFGLNNDTDLEIRSTVTVSGGTFNGSGAFRVFGGGRLRLVHGTQVGVAVVNEGGIVEPGPGPAHVTVESFGQNIFGTLEMRIDGSPGSGNYDKLIVEETASIAGTLSINFNVPGAQPCDTWQVIAAGDIANSFNQLLVVGVEPGLKLVKYETDTGVFLTLTEDKTFAAWASGKGLVPPDNDPGDDPDHDGLVNAFEALVSGNPLVANGNLLSPASLVAVSGTNYLALTLRRDAGVNITNLQFGAKQSTNLVNWTTNNVVLHSQTFDANACDEVFTYRSIIPFATLPKEFLKLEVKLVSP